MYSNYFNLRFIYYCGKSLLRNFSNNIFSCLCFSKKRKFFRYRKSDYFFRNPVYKEPDIYKKPDIYKEPDIYKKKPTELEEIIIIPNHLIKDKNDFKLKTSKDNYKMNQKKFKLKNKKISINHLKKINYKKSMNEETTINKETPINKSVRKIIQNENIKIKELVFDHSYSNFLKKKKVILN